MFPRVFSLSTWHIFYLLAAMSAWFYFRNRLQRIHPIGMDTHFFFISAYCGAYLGARAFSVFVESNLVWPESLYAVFQLGSMTFYGGLIGASICGFLYFWVRNLPIEYAALGFRAGFLALAIGRIGCFCNGDDYGLVNHDWGVVFASHSPALPRLPVQLWESVGVLLILYFTRRLNFKYMVGGLVVCYGVLRFCLEFFRDDYRGKLWSDVFSPAQEISVVLVAVCVCWLFWVKVLAMRGAGSEGSKLRH